MAAALDDVKTLQMELQRAKLEEEMQDEIVIKACTKVRTNKCK